MGINIMLPQINAGTGEGQLVQIKSYLYQLAEQLNWALGEVTTDSDKSGNIANASSAVASSAAAIEKTQAENTFNSIKGLIIKSADLVEAFSEQISKKITGQYVARSEYGVFKENTETAITATSKALEIKFSNDQEVDSEGNYIEYTTIRSADAWAKVGVLAYDSVTGFPIYGMEIGQFDTVDGATVDKRFARYTSNGVALYGDDPDEPVAQIDQSTLTITHANISKSLSLGGYVIDVERNNGIVFKWRG